MPPNPPSIGSQLRGMYIQNPRNFKVGPPPLRNPAYTPAINYHAKSYQSTGACPGRGAQGPAPPLEIEQLKMNHMFNIIHGNSPAYLKEDISLQDNTRHQTRSVTSLSCQTPRVNSFGLRSFFYTAIKCWNSLPFSLRSISTKQLYKNNLKKVFGTNLGQKIKSYTFTTSTIDSRHIVYKINDQSINVLFIVTCLINC